MITGYAKLFLNYHIKCLKFMGIWKPEKRSRIYDLYQMSSFGVQYCAHLFTYIYIGMVWGDLQNMSMGLYVLFTQACACLKITSMVVNRKTFEKLFEFMNRDVFVTKTEKQYKILSVHCLRMRRLYFSLLSLVALNCLEWSLVPLISKGPRLYPFTMWMPGNIDKSPDYQLGYAFQMWFSFMGTFTFITIDCLTITFIGFGCAQLDIIKDKLQKIRSVPYSGHSGGVTREERDDIMAENNMILNECLTQHQAIIEFITSVQSFFNFNIFFQLSGSVAIICLIAFRISIESPNTAQFYSSLTYMLDFVAQLFFYCWSGDQLTTSSEELRDVLYQCPWYEQDIKFRRTLWIAMECMKKPIVFEAGHFIILSRPTFVSILRCSYSYFAVLNQVE